MQFNWSFSGDVKYVYWGLTQAADAIAFDNNQMLMLLTKVGSMSVTPPSAYTGRVLGNRSGHQVIFTLSNLNTSDGRFYGCRISSPPDGGTSFDNVQLVVEGQ